MHEVVSVPLRNSERPATMSSLAMRASRPPARISALPARPSAGPGLDGDRVRSTATWGRRDGSICYSSDIELDGSTDAQSKQDLREPSGSVVASAMVDREAGTWTVTCTGGRPVLVNMDACSADARLDGGR
jgi:hypothetical protein